MELKLQSYHKDLYPACGFFIEDSTLTSWVSVLDKLHLNPESLNIYPLPSQKVNEIWGCLVIIDPALLPLNLGVLISALRVGEKLIVPEKSKVVPGLMPYDLDQLFRDGDYLLHPEIGLYKLTEPLSMYEYIKLGEVKTIESLRPKSYHSISGAITGFSIESSPVEELKKELDSFAEREKFQDKPLSFVEKIRLEFYKKLLITGKEGSGKFDLTSGGSAIQRIADKLGIDGSGVNKGILEDFNNLQERNKKEVDKLMDLLKDNPEEALRFAIPLEEHGYSRGGKHAEFKMHDRNVDYSLFNGIRNRGGGGSVNLGDEYFRLRQQYLDSAQKLKKKGQYDKAAFVYLKLLKDYRAAGATLREGGKFEKAALVYLEYEKNEELAAACYEEGKIYKEAISLYKKLKKEEKVGDLYILLGNRKSANRAYQNQIDQDLQSNQYVKAASISKNKMLDLQYAQKLLLRGWEIQVDQYNCIHNYFNNISEPKEAWQEMMRIRSELNSGNDVSFLKLLKHEFAHQDENEQRVRNMAYDLLSDLLEDGKVSAHELLDFNRENRPLRADAMRFELKKNKRMSNEQD